jgi:hypothetical protein
MRKEKNCANFKSFVHHKSEAIYQRENYFNILDLIREARQAVESPHLA